MPSARFKAFNVKPTASSAEARRRMQAVRQRDTASERELRSALHRLGLRYRLQRILLPGSRRRADFVFIAARVAVFVDGCFWHSCPIHGTTPKANRKWWMAKLDANQRRDRDTNEALSRIGWIVIRIWEHENVDEAAARIASVVATATRTSSRRAVRGRPKGATQL